MTNKQIPTRFKPPNMRKSPDVYIQGKAAWWIELHYQLNYGIFTLLHFQSNMGLVDGALLL